ncbi:S8 family serine peptidase, partial [Acinetobacter baumannii]
SAVPGGGYARFSGTSMATPMIAGALAVLHAAYPGYQAFDYETALVRGGKALLLDGQVRLPRLDLPTTDAILAGNAGGSSLSGPYQAASPV